MDVLDYKVERHGDRALYKMQLRRSVPAAFEGITNRLAEELDSAVVPRIKWP
ncbi:MAG: hypothetical protein KAX44_05125 [Candidatus Brocadiae bacterium]|nr:hypothetical protein [Candidatus Brocadiia bacterium]